MTAAELPAQIVHVLQTSVLVRLDTIGQLCWLAAAYESLKEEEKVACISKGTAGLREPTEGEKVLPADMRKSTLALQNSCQHGTTSQLDPGKGHSRACLCGESSHATGAIKHD